MILPPCVGVDLDLHATPLQEFEDLINFYADKECIDPLDIAAIIMVESGGDPNAYNEKSMATGLGQVMPFEAGPMFKYRPTIEELKDPETNIYYLTMIYGYWFYKLHSRLGALYHYSGGAYWKDVERYRKIYWEKFLEKRSLLYEAGARYKVAQCAGHPGPGNTGPVQ